MWIEHRDVEGGPAAFFGENVAAWYNTLGTAADVTANVFGDGLMVRVLSFEYLEYMGYQRTSALSVSCVLGSLKVGHGVPRSYLFGFSR